MPLLQIKNLKISLKFQACTYLSSLTSSTQHLPLNFPFSSLKSSCKALRNATRNFTKFMWLQPVYNLSSSFFSLQKYSESPFKSFHKSLTSSFETRLYIFSLNLTRLPFLLYLGFHASNKTHTQGCAHPHTRLTFWKVYSKSSYDIFMQIRVILFSGN